MCLTGTRGPCHLSKNPQTITIESAEKAGKLVKGVGTIVVLECGLSKRSRTGLFYMEESLLDDAEMFNGVKMYANHGWGSERDVNEEIGFVKKAWADRERKQIRASVVITDPTFKEKFAAYEEHDAEELLQFSIRAEAVAEQKKNPNGDGYEEFMRVSRLSRVISVDHV